ncbi:tRNA pseudouridine synthase A [Rubripirellula amarantea]|uniref:tRNA pseudouridine synthase A n=1 Tax=Rubripirellula amarantea TaxID=2527999 RepID=A0A5C5WSM0_9BACT|nr:tRNA pseudouridine(38-40) synthase TruA [Rubripirellula amarantea]TWT53145.1 tRNA pseudouridine synthase A [Rubripirellula amarantea]
MPRFFQLTIAYDGTDFVGWQVQPSGRSIQALLEKAVRKVTGESIRVIGSGRTDAGVHAIAQVASVEFADWKHSANDLMRGMNRHLPDSILVHNVVEMLGPFHAIRDAVGKRYRYQLQVGGLRNPFQHRYVWHMQYELSIEAMRAAAELVVGKQDFACFQTTGADRKSTVRDVRACDVIIRTDTEVSNPELASGGFASGGFVDGRGRSQLRIDIEVEADGFLYNMVRSIVGTLVQVGRGRRSPDWVTQLITNQDRTKAGETAPPQGLFLLRVDYEASLPKS